VSIRRVRERIKRNMLATLAFSQGVPMITAGDEMGKTQHGNNNAYCQDNEISWIHWDLDERQRALLGFTRQLFAIYRANPVLRRRTFFSGHPIAPEGIKDVLWLRPDGTEMTGEDWTNQSLQVLGMLLHGGASDDMDDRGQPVGGDTLLVLLNGGRRSRTFSLPNIETSGTWYEVVNTAQPSDRFIKTATIKLMAHSVILLRYAEAV
jgi:glycogen operon protein